MGDAHERQRRHFSSHIRYRERPSRSGAPVFIKKTQRTPRMEIDLALERAKELDT